MIRQTKASLRKRWDTAGTIDLGFSPFGLTELGLRDFRGLPLAKFQRSHRLNSLADKFVAGCDFTHAEFGSAALEDLRVVECEFTSADFEEVLERGCLFDHCRFQDSSFKRAFLGFRPSRYEGCAFNRCKFIKPSIKNAVFTDCSFVDNRMYHFFCEGTGFWRCKFVGLLDDITFLGDYNFKEDEVRFGVPRQSGLHDVDLSQARLHNVGFRNECALENITLPSDGSACILDRSVLIDRINELRRTFPDIDQELENYCFVETNHKRQSQLICSLWDVIDAVGQEAAGAIYAAITSGVVQTPDVSQC